MCREVQVVSGVGPPSASFWLVDTNEVPVSWLIDHVMLWDGPGVSVQAEPQMAQLAGVHVFGFEKSVVKTPSWHETVPEEVSAHPATVSVNDAFVPS
jgi:hypothetical protein